MTKFRRRLQSIGSSTLVSLPKEWVDANNLKKGDEVNIETEHGTLVLHATSNRPAKELEILYPLKAQENIVANITGAYLLGYDIIRISAERDILIKDRDNIRNAMRRLVGMEIVEETAQSLRIQFLPDATMLRPQLILGQMNMIVIAMHNDLLTAIKSHDRSNLETLASRDDEVNRQYFLLVRLVRSVMTDRRLASAFSLENIDVLDYRIAANLIEGAGDTIVELADALYETSSSEADLGKIYDIVKGSKRVAELGVNALVDRNRTMAIDAIQAHRTIQNKMSTLRSSLERRGKIPLDYLDILHMFERIERSWADVADLITPDYGRETDAPSN